MELSQQQCEACRADAPKVEAEQQQELLKELQGWSIEQQPPRLIREFSFANFKQAMGFSVQVGMLAEQFDHHPEIVTEWGKVRVSWWTHKIAGLHLNDFILAAKTDKLL